MKLALITPTAGLEKYATQGDVHLCLVQEILNDSVYAEFYRHESEIGKLVIMDNGTFEQGFPCDNDAIAEAAARVAAQVVVAPDFPNQPFGKTKDAVLRFAKQFPSLALMVVPQTKAHDPLGFVAAVHECVWGSLHSALGNQLRMIGLSILNCPIAFSRLTGTDEPEINRFVAACFIKDALPDIRKYNAPLFHFLGAGARLDLIQYHDLAYSLDTSSPVWHGWHGIAYSHGFLPQGKLSNRVDFQARSCNSLFDGIIRRNIDVLRNHAAQASKRRNDSGFQD